MAPFTLCFNIHGTIIMVLIMTKGVLQVMCHRLSAKYLIMDFIPRFIVTKSEV